ncbi:MAG TPA: ParB/RepB/Spo0J family partition protein [Stellaceae bacterium]|nr:ParB/RepB/Spo0J family partition protein [Stellaceae bacterium]
MAADPKRKSLGMGLSALFGEDATGGTKPPATVATAAIHPGRYQPRRAFDEDKLEALAQSVREKGILQPLLVRPHPAQPHQFELIAGERRWRAAQRAQLHEVPVVVREFSDRDALEIALVENLQREDLNPVEEAEAYLRLIEEFGHTQEDLARVLGRSRSHVGNIVRLAHAGGKVRTYLEQGKLTAGHARALLGAANADRLADEIVNRDLTVRQAEALAAKKPRPRKATKSADTLALERDLADRWGVEVRIRETPGGGGALTVAYDTLDQLEDFIARVK